MLLSRITSVEAREVAVNVVLEGLVALTGRLEPVADTPDSALRSLRRFVAASLIQQNPAALPIPQDPTVDPAIVEAATAGADLAAELAPTGTRLRFSREDYLSSSNRAELPVRRFGPFRDGDGTLARFHILQNQRRLGVFTRLPFGAVGEEILELPEGTVASPGNQEFSIPAGTVWIRARFLVANMAGFAGLRVSGGVLQVNRAGLMVGPRLMLLFGSQWTLTVEPEQQAGGEWAVGMPATLRVRSNAPPSTTGPLSLSGFGSSLEFPAPSGGPFAETGAVSFPYEPGESPWSVAGTLLPVAQVTGECPVAEAKWQLPVSVEPVASLGEAAGSGTVVARLLASLEARISNGQGVFRAFDTWLSARPDRVELDAIQAEALARLELDLWPPAQTDGSFSGQPLTRLVLAREQGGASIAMAGGGRIRNRWDLPLTASGKPFAYEGTINLFAMISSAAGSLHAACMATQQAEPRTEGIALENVYMTVRPPRRLAFFGDFDSASRLAAGSAVLFFDVTMAQPSLPDPYAANWTIPSQFSLTESALSLTIRWLPEQVPQLEARLENNNLLFPTPRETPADDDLVLRGSHLLRRAFDGHLGSQPELHSLLDVSSGDDLLGVAVESLFDSQPTIRQNRLSVELRGVRLLMQPQVQWEPVQVVPNPDAGAPNADRLVSLISGARTLAGALSVKLVPVLPGAVCAAIAEAARQRLRCGVLFSLPFGIRAFARLDSLGEQGLPIATPAIEATIHQPRFDDLESARQFRLVATGFQPDEALRDPSRTMPGAMIQLPNLAGNLNNLASVMSGGVDVMLDEFRQAIPLHQADLSGYGLSTFSDWRRSVEVGVVQVRFDVLNGRTSYEVIEARSVMAFCRCHVVRTIILERRNSGNVLRFDSGWQPVDDGEFGAPTAFQKGVVKAFRRIRHIRILNTPLLTLKDGSLWQPVLFDADADLENVTAGGAGGMVPMFGHPGYIQLAPTGPGAEPLADRFAALFEKLGTAAGGPIDCGIRAGGALEMHLSGIYADDARTDGGLNPIFVLAAYGSPKLPRAGQWSAVRVKATTLEAAPVDPRHGMPVIRTGTAYRFLDPADAQRFNPDGYGFLMSTPASRVLFPSPSIDPNAGGRLTTAKPLVADPCALVQSSGAFPRSNFALRCQQAAEFSISPDNAWRLLNGNFVFDAPVPDLAKGGDWLIQRAFPGARGVDVLVDSAIENVPWDIGTTPNDLNIVIDPFPDPLFIIRTNYKAATGELAKLQKPTLDFGPALSAVKEIVDALKGLVNLGFDFDVDVAAGNGPSPSFIVRVKLKFRIGEGPNERIDIGVGKFYGEFRITGELEAALSGSTRGLLSAEFQGDIQQGILPPLLYAGGLFRFAIQITETGKPTIELALGVTASIGGDLIKGLVEVEITVKYGYMLIPETLQPGVLLGMEARAKVLSGLVGFSFAVQAMARIERVTDKNVHIWADIRVAASVQVAWLIEEEVDFETQFEQDIPLWAVAAAGGLQFFPVLAAV